jgi:hypothetical protein
MQTVVDCCKLSHTHNTGLMIVKNLPRILLQQNNKNKKTRKKKKKKKKKNKKLGDPQNWLSTMQIM